MGLQERYDAMTRVYPWQNDVYQNRHAAFQQSIGDMNLGRINYAGGVLHPEYAPLVREAFLERRRIGPISPHYLDQNGYQGFHRNIGSASVDIGRGEPIYHAAHPSGGGWGSQAHGERRAMLDVLRQINQRALTRQDVGPHTYHPVLEAFRQQEMQHGMNAHGAVDLNNLNTPPQLIQEYNDALHGYGNPASVKIYSERFPCSNTNPNNTNCLNFFPPLLQGLRDRTFLYSAPPFMEDIPTRTLLRNQALGAEQAMNYNPPVDPQMGMADLYNLLGHTTRLPNPFMISGYRPPPGGRPLNEL